MRQPYSGKAYARNGHVAVLNKQRNAGSNPATPSIHNLFKELDCDKETKEGLIQMFLEDYEYYVYKFVCSKWTIQKFIYAHWHNFVPYVRANKKLLLNYRSFQKNKFSMSKIKRIYVENLRAITMQELNLNGCTAIITGANNAGKSTLSTALIQRMRSVKSDTIVKQGEKDGRYEMELTTGEQFVWWVDSNGKEKMTFISERNIKGSLTKELCTFYFPKTFDVDEFLNETPAKQSKMLQKISGLDFSDWERSYKSAYEERTWANRKFAEAEAKRIKFEPTWFYEKRPTEVIEKEIEGIEAHNLRYTNIATAVKQKEELVVGYDAEIEKLREQIKQIEAKKETVAAEILKGYEWMANEKFKPKDEEHKQKLKQNLADIRANNAAIEVEDEFKKCEKSATDAEAEVKKCLSDKAEMIRLADLPEGFGFNDEGITYKGLPFDKKSLSTSAIYIAALKLAAKGLGDVKAIHFEASSLDKKSLMEIMEWADEEGLQLLIERPDFEGGPIQYEIIEEPKS
jgi:AAA15 family ATPase/GTPase